MTLLSGRAWKAAVCLGLLSACSGGGSTAVAPGDFRVRFMVSNDLLAPVTIAVDDTPYVILTTGRSTEVAAPTAAHVLSWTSANTTDSTGRQILDDIDTVTISIGLIQSALEITNIIQGETYFTAHVFNTTTAQVDIGVFNGATVSCAGILPPAVGPAAGFVQIGYYRIRSATEVRAYRDRTDCTGPYVAWPRSALASPEPKSGSLSLILTTAP